MSHIYETGLEPRPANYVPLTPTSFLIRAAAVHPQRLAWVHGERRVTYQTYYERCRRLASALRKRGVNRGDTVSVMAPNNPAILEAHFGVPMAGAVLNTLNIRLDPATIAFGLAHAETKVLLTDREFAPTVAAALAQLGEAGQQILIIDIDDPEYDGPGDRLGEIEYEEFLQTGDPADDWIRPENEWDAICLNYTSGTTGNPKGVVYHHRGAYLLALGNVLAWELAAAPIYLWTLPLFHCNGWCFPWTLAAVCGTSVMLRRVEAEPIYRLLAEEQVTHLCGAPVVMNLLLNAPAEIRRPIGGRVQMMTAASAPPSSVIAGMEELGFRISHVYGLTETYGPAALCDWHPEWDALPLEERAALKARQGVAYHVLEGLTVADPETLVTVPADGKTMGEVLFRGNVVMKGYLKNPTATAEAFQGGWFHSGDLGVLHPDGYIELKDRSKDIIISGGENISTLEVEECLYRHPAVLDAAVVARPDEKWGETPCAFLFLKAHATAVTEAEIIAFCRERLAHYKVPKTVVFGPLPRTSTGKVQKFVLRERAAQLK